MDAVFAYAEKFSAGHPYLVLTLKGLNVAIDAEIDQLLPSVQSMLPESTGKSK